MDSEWQMDFEQACADRQLYLQPVERGDRFRYMFSASDNLSRSLQIINTKGVVVATIAQTGTVDVPGNLDADNQQMHTYVYKMPDYSAVPVDGVYFLKLTIQYDATRTDVYIGDPLNIRATHEDTQLLEYDNSINKDGSYFEQLPTVYALRVESFISDFEPASSDTVYEDQGGNLSQLDSTAYRGWTWHVGEVYQGIPDWFLDKLNRIFGCDRIRFDAKQYLKASGAKWNKGAGRLFGATIDLREAHNGEGFEHIDGTIDIYTPPGFPYAVQGFTVNGHNILPAAIINDLSEETAMLAALNAALSNMELYGQLVKTGSIIQYISADYELNYTASATIYATSFGFTYNSPGGVGFNPTLSFTVSGGSHIVEWGDGALTAQSVFFPTATSHAYGSTAGPKIVRIWGTLQSFFITSTLRSGLTGKFPVGFKSLTISGGSFSSNLFNASVLSLAQASLNTLSIQSAGLTGTIGISALNFPFLNSVNLSNNPFTTTSKSNAMIDVYNNAYNNSIPFGTFSITQTPTVSMNTAGNFYKNQLTTSPLFWTVNS
jgi:hypothetical protein